MKLVSIFLIFATSCLFAADWPQWGGPNRNFQVKAPALLDQWPQDGPKILWETPLGRGYAGIVTKGDVLYTSFQKDDMDTTVALSSKKEGKVIWSKAYPSHTLEGHVLQFGKAPNTTPLIAGDALITVTFSGVMRAHNLKDGALLWTHDLIKDHGGKIHKFGYSISPILYKGNVIALIGGKEGIAAINPKTGDFVWKSPTYDTTYASPKIFKINGEDQIVFWGGEDIRGVDASNGAPLWDYPISNQYKNHGSDPILIGDGLILAPSQMQSATRALKISKADGAYKVEEAWFNNKVKNHHWNIIHIGDHLYFSIGETTSFVACVEAATGKIVWQERGFNMINSIYADNKIIFTDHDGMLGLARISPKGFDLIGKMPLLKKTARTPPTLVGSTLYARDEKRLVAIDFSK